MRQLFAEVTRLRDLALSEGRTPWWLYCTVVQETNYDGEVVAVFLQCTLCPKSYSALRYRAFGSELINGGYGNCPKIGEDVLVQAQVLEAFGTVQDDSNQKAGDKQSDVATIKALQAQVEQQKQTKMRQYIITGVGLSFPVL